MQDYNKAIDKPKTVADIRDEPLDIPPGFYWANINIEDDNEKLAQKRHNQQNLIDREENLVNIMRKEKLDYHKQAKNLNKIDWLDRS